MEAVALEKKPRCPKGQIRNKEGTCIPKVEKAKVKEPKVKEPKTKKQKTNANAKTIKKLTKKQLVDIIKQRKDCIQRFRDNL
jgi:hypothetical protein